MAANLADHMAIVSINTTSGNQPQIGSINEKASQTFKLGTPVELSAGVVRDWDGVTLTKGIAGITLIDGSNYATDGAGAPDGFNGIGQPGTGTTFGSVPYQSSAFNIPMGAPFATGMTLFEIANDDTLFEAQIDNSAAGAYASLQSQIGVEFGLTKDASGHWYIDLNKTTVGTNTAVVIEGFNPIEPLGTNGARAYFRFIKAVQQLNP